MRALLTRAYGATEFTEIDRPQPGADDVLIRVRATSVNPYDWHGVFGEPRVARPMMGMRRPKLPVLGCDLAGRIEAVGKNVTGLRPGDDVYALVAGGGFAEYACVPHNLVAPKPANLDYGQAAAIPMAAVTALMSLSRVTAGDKVLINGASGGVGTFAVQIAKALDARVTAVCGPHNAELVRSLGADEVIDYRTTDFTRTSERYDVLLDIAGGHSGSACRGVMTRTGTFVAIGGPATRWLQPAGHVMAVMAMGRFVSQHVTVTEAPNCPDKKDRLIELTALVEKQAVTPVIDRTYAFAELLDAIAYQKAGHAKGKVVVHM